MLEIFENIFYLTLLSWQDRSCIIGPDSGAAHPRCVMMVLGLWREAPSLSLRACHRVNLLSMSQR